MMKARNPLSAEKKESRMDFMINSFFRGKSIKILTPNRFL
jgi:hypothetical protein